MPRLRSIITLLLLTLSVEVFAQRHSELEFAGIPFGVSRDVVIEELMKMGYDTFDQGGHIQVPVFKFGDLPVQVDFIFNANDKFYAFEIRTGRVEGARKGKAMEAAEYMSEQFTLKYGKPSGEPAVQEVSLRSGRNIYQEWYGVKALNAATSVVKQGEKYFTMGVVEHRTLAKESRPVKKAKEKASAEPVF